MSFLILQAYLKLIHFDLYLARGNFAALYRKVRGIRLRRKLRLRMLSSKSALPWTWPVSGIGKRHFACSAPQPQRGLLKRYGVPAQMVIGAQQLPFKAHAWVEVDGRVVNDKSYTRERYAVLDRC